MNTPDKIPNESRNWFIVEIIEKCEPVSRDENHDLRRVTTWGNHHLINASSPSQAYDKAVAIGKSGNYKFKNKEGIEMEWIFVGIGDLLPIYEDIEDGAELMWTDYGFISNRRTMRMPISKMDLIESIKPKEKL